MAQLYNCFQFPSILMLWVSQGFVEFWMTVGIVLAVAKSAARLAVEERAVLITGKAR